MKVYICEQAGMEGSMIHKVTTNKKIAQDWLYCANAILEINRKRLDVYSEVIRAHWETFGVLPPDDDDLRKQLEAIFWEIEDLADKYDCDTQYAVPQFATWTVEK
mgnify:CR=1 FL=1